MFVSASMHDVMITLSEALLLVFAVVFLFLQSWRTTLITGIAIPVSLIGTLAIMYAMGFSLNTVSMLGMVLAIGLVVDDAIVVVENVERQLENGLAPLTAAKVAMSEVTGPIIATSAVLGAVFVPVAFLPGVTGRLYNQFALTIAISIAISAFNSLTLSPALCAVLLRHRPPPSFFLFRKFNQGFDWTARTYGRGVRQLAKNALRVAGAVCDWHRRDRHALHAATLRLPADRRPRLFLRHYPIARRRIAAADRCDDREGARRHHETSGDEQHHFVVGLNFLTGSTGSNSAAAFAILKPWEERGPGQSVGEVMADLRKELTDIDAGVVVTFDPPSIPGIGQTGGFEFQLEDLTNHGAFALEESTKALIAEAKKAAGDRSEQGVYDLQHDDTAIQIRPRPGQNQTARAQSARRFQHAADFLRLALCQRLQPVRPHVSGDRTGREGCALGSDGSQPPLRAQQCRPHGAVVDVGLAAANDRAGHRAALQSLQHRKNQRPSGAGLFLGPDDCGHAAGCGKCSAARFRL
jgi:HAE1 family hydrophobic/amphiphilic exporter-1